MTAHASETDRPGFDAESPPARNRSSLNQTDQQASSRDGKQGTEKETDNKARRRRERVSEKSQQCDCRTQQSGVDEERRREVRLPGTANEESEFFSRVENGGKGDRGAS